MTNPFTLPILHPERKKAGWELISTFFSARADQAEVDGDIDMLEGAEREASKARHMVSIMSGTSEGPASAWRRLRRVQP